MEVVQVRMPKGMIKEIDVMVKKGRYANRSDVIRVALRMMGWRNMIGSIPNTGDSVQEVKEIRRKLSKEINSFDYIEKINKLADWSAPFKLDK